jgi:superfamily I DNA/RNA helicase
MSWLVQKRMLDKDQRKAIDLVVGDGNYFVKGDPGTGKSIVLAHAAQEFKITHPGAKVCVLTYTNALVACLQEGLDGSGVPVMTFNRFAGEKSPYDLVFVDEAQDLNRSWVPRLKRFGRKFVLFGDFAQTLYGTDGSCISEKDLMSEFGIRGVCELKVDYRLPRNIRTLVQALFPERTFDSKVWHLMSNAQIPLYHASDWDAEMAFVVKKAQNHAVVGKPVAILFERKMRVFRFFYTVLEIKSGQKIQLETVNDLLKERDLPFRFLGNGIGDLKEGDEKPLTYVMTWHSSKGLDFETVILPDIGSSPCHCNPLYVAVTRSRRNLVLSYSRQNDQIEKAKACPCVCPIASDGNGGESVQTGGITQGTLF